MVSRKPVPNSGLAPPTSPPYPVTPTSPSTQNLRPIPSDPEIENAWSDEGASQSNSKTVSQTNLPESLRVGPHGPPNSSQESFRPLAPTNPYLRRHNTGSSNGESSANAWNETEKPPMPSSAPPPPPIPKDAPPSQQLANLSISESNTNPWQPALDEKSSKSIPPPILRPEDSGNDAWAAPPARPAPTVPPVDTSQPVLVDLEEAESPAWDEDEPSPVVHEMPADNATEAHQIQEEAHAWDDTTGQAGPGFVAHETTQGEWNLIDHDPISQHQQSGVISGNGNILETFHNEEDAPALPPRSQEHPPPQPPRPTVQTDENAAAEARKQKKETYEIKKITWHDVNAAENPRVSPILVQNANGPCPLLALVNALTLSTPANVETALVETLRSREQVSLGLLLDAVFDELMSGRRGDAAQELPDVSDLYSFLITLHTGMNVNPRFIPLPATSSPKDPRNSMSHVHPTDRETNIPGVFEETREMRLYSTFSVPLIHGWVPEKDSPASAALRRSAQSYEDAQNLMFHEEELEDKLQAEGLSFEEQGMLEDIATIKAFFASNATQLTRYGLSCITTSLAPGAVAILFRNDHFSTLYRHPQTLQLLQLVTDMGYAGHEEVVWESLIDINGENAEFFSGDFRLVGGAASTSQPNNENWAAVTGRRQAGGNSNLPNETPQSPTTEQEDHDLALALQLQEEEEERHREELARRRRETELSQQYIEQQGSSPTSVTVPVSHRGGARSTGRRHTSNRGGGSNDLRPAIPPRRNNVNAAPVQAAAPVPTPHDPEAGVDVPPPSYEMAASQEAYVPPENHPAHPSASTRRQTDVGVSAGRGGGRGRRPTLVDQIPPGTGLGPRRNTGPGQSVGAGQDRERDCAIM